MVGDCLKFYDQGHVIRFNGTQQFKDSGIQNYERPNLRFGTFLWSMSRIKMLRKIQFMAFEGSYFIRQFISNRKHNDLVNRYAFCYFLLQRQ